MVFYVVTSSVGLALVVLAVLVLRRYGLVKPDDATVINNLLIYLVFPAHILHRVMYADLGWEQVRMVVTLLTLCFVDLALAYAVGRLLRRSRPEIGALMLTTGFAATAVIAAPVLFLLYPNDIERHADLIIVSEFGMSLPTLLLAPVIAQLFGVVLYGPQNYGTLFAAGILAILPPVTLAFVFQRYLVQGLTAGSVKG